MYQSRIDGDVDWVLTKMSIDQHSTGDALRKKDPNILQIVSLSKLSLNLL